MSKDHQYYESFEELYLDNRKLIFSFLKASNIKTLHLQDELASEVWLKVIEKQEIFFTKEKKHVKNYLRVMIKNTIIDYYRAVGYENDVVKKMGTLIELAKMPASVEETVLAKEQKGWLNQCLKSLSEDDKNLIVLRFGYGLSARETGEILGISEGNVRVRQKRILEKLRKIFNLSMESREESEHEG